MDRPRRLLFAAPPAHECGETHCCGRFAPCKRASFHAVFSSINHRGNMKTLYSVALLAFLLMAPVASGQDEDKNEFERAATSRESAAHAYKKQASFCIDEAGYYGGLVATNDAEKMRNVKNAGIKREKAGDLELEAKSQFLLASTNWDITAKNYGANTELEERANNALKQYEICKSSALDCMKTAAINYELAAGNYEEVVEDESAARCWIKTALVTEEMGKTRGMMGGKKK